MKKYQFKTNINCGGCVASVTPHLENNQDIITWSVDAIDPGKVLTVETEQLERQHVKELVEKAGFKAEPL